jgi:hypothetical protein
MKVGHIPEALRTFDTRGEVGCDRIHRAKADAGSPHWLEEIEDQQRLQGKLWFPWPMYIR